MFKRFFDIIASAIGVIVLLPLLAVVAIAVKCSSRGGIIFRHKRMGKGAIPFDVLKFRTMVADAPRLGGQITAGDDPRITTVGKILRKTKIDELPQLFNVLHGDMSLVGPRPEVCKYVEMFAADYEEILSVRPGITDLASIRYLDEATILGQAADPEAEYVRRVLPEKIALAKEYVRNRSFWLDLSIIIGTLWSMCREMIARVRNRRSSIGDHPTAA